MTESNATNKKQTTWASFFKWTSILYIISLGGVFLKIFLQEGGKFAFTHYGQIALVSAIPLVFMILVSPVLLVGLAFKKFKIQNSKNVLYFTALIYVIGISNRLLSSQPL